MYMNYLTGAGYRRDFNLNNKARRVLEKNWPRKWVDGVEVLDDLTMYSGNRVWNHSEVYKILDMDYATLIGEEWKEVDWAGIKFNYIDPDVINFSKLAIHQHILTNYTRSYQIAENSLGKHDEIWKTKTFYINLGTDKDSTNTRLPVIQSDFNSGNNLRRYMPGGRASNIAVPDQTADALWGMAYADTSKHYFDRIVEYKRVRYRLPAVGAENAKLVEQLARLNLDTAIAEVGDYVYEVVLSYRLKDDAYKLYAPDANDTLTKIRTNDVWTQALYDRAYTADPADSVTGVYSDEVWHRKGTHVPTDSVGNSSSVAGQQVNLSINPEHQAEYGSAYDEYDITYKYYIKAGYGRVGIDVPRVKSPVYAGILALSLQNFAALFRAAIRFEYIEKRVPFWQKVLLVIIIIIIIIVTKWSLGTLAVKGAKLIASAAAIMSMGSAAVSLVLNLAAMYYADQGQRRHAAQLGKTAVVFSEISKYLGYLALVAGGVGILTGEASAAASKAATKKALEEGMTSEAAKQAGTVAASSAVSALAIGKLALKGVTAITNELIKDDAETDAEEIAELQSSLDAQEEFQKEFKIGEYATSVPLVNSPKLQKAIEAVRYTNEYAELQNKIENMVYNMTEGLIVNSTRMYYS